MSAASASSAQRKPTARPRARSGPRGGAAVAGRVRWDRLGRTAMLCVLAALVYLYLSAGIHMLSTWRQAHRDRAVVASLTLEHNRLVRQHAALSRQSTLEEEARQLGMIKKGEQPYIVSGLPAN
jgi:cell division protein FtsB